MNRNLQLKQKKKSNVEGDRKKKISLQLKDTVLAENSLAVCRHESDRRGLFLPIYLLIFLFDLGICPLQCKQLRNIIQS